MSPAERAGDAIKVAGEEIVATKSETSVFAVEMVQSEVPAAGADKMRAGAELVEKRREEKMEERTTTQTMSGKAQRAEHNASQVVFRDRFVPLVPRQVTSTDVPRMLAEAPKRRVAHALQPAMANRGKERNREAAGGAKPAEREPDEIQIHIGRIEVTATPPAPARPAAKPMRKTPTLDDYLKRRHGRT